MTELTVEIRTLRDANQQFLRAAARSTQETLSRLNPDAGLYDSRGTSNTPPDNAHLFDKDL